MEVEDKLTKKKQNRNQLWTSQKQARVGCNFFDQERIERIHTVQ